MNINRRLQRLEQQITPPDDTPIVWVYELGSPDILFHPVTGKAVMRAALEALPGPLITIPRNHRDAGT